MEVEQKHLPMMTRGVVTHHNEGWRGVGPKIVESAMLPKGICFLVDVGAMKTTCGEKHLKCKQLKNSNF